MTATLTEEREQQLLHAVSEVYRPEVRHAATLDTTLIREACWREERLTIRYTDEHGADTQRTILPLAIVDTERHSVVLAWCQLREAFRMSRLDRIDDVRNGAGSFRPRLASLLRVYLEQLRHVEVSPATSHGPNDR